MTPPPGTESIETFASALTGRSSPRYSINWSGNAGHGREWWEQKPQRAIRRDMAHVAAFEFDIPEHLPASPLCPANAKHKSGGTGLCVYHGRRRAKSTLRDEMARRRTSAGTN